MKVTMETNFSKMMTEKKPNENGVTAMNNSKMNSKTSKDRKEHRTDEGNTADLKTGMNKMTQSKCRPMKKRSHTASTTNGVVPSGSSSSEEPANKKQQRGKSSPGGRAIDAEKSVVESLMLMSSHRK